ncbi:MAG: low affinity iron permease family protein [Steroidobacteraceae bacterium]
MRARHRGSWFTRFAKITARAAGQPATFCAALAVILIWAVSGPFFGFSDTWQLVINTGTTIITFLMVFLIQNTQNRDSEAIQVKLDELIRSIDGAHLALLDLEELEDKDLDRICKDYRELAKEARRDLREGKSDTDIREVGAAHRKEVSEKRRRSKTTK